MKETITYKQTEVGLIPSDWEVKKLGMIANIIGGGTPSSFVNSYWNGNINWFTPTEIGKEKYSYESIRKISKHGFENCSAKMLPVGTILLTTRAGIGDVSILMQEGCTNQGFQSFIVKNDIDNEYMYYLISTLKNIFLQNASGSTFLEISPNRIRSIQIPLPPTKAEQTAIATALSDADALIIGLEKVITKKRNIKQGAMQKLLQPKEGWETKTIKELTKYRRGSFPQPYGLDKWYDDTNGYPFVQVYDVDNNFRLKNETKRKISKDAQDMSVYIAKGSVIITLQGSIGRIAITQYDAYVDRTLLFFESFIIPFDKYFFVLSIFNLFEKEKEKAPGGIIKTITKEALSSFKISYPKIEEQTRIATILSDMDAEINALETKLEKYKKVKLGMMQELLTGKIRLI
jgi:type I restriction enzyme, S subunit